MSRQARPFEDQAITAVEAVDGQNQGGRPATLQVQKGEIVVIGPQDVAEAKPIFPKPKLT